jgi:lipoprotein-anchoring transpeptidase ErfK/SrfK
VARPTAVVPALVAGFLSAQLFLPATTGLSAAEPVDTASSGALPAAVPVSAAALPRSPARHSGARSTPAKAVPRNSGTGRRVVYSVSKQRVWAVGGEGRVQRTYLVSGRATQPSPSHYRVYSKSRWTSSTVSAETMQYMVRFAHGARTGTPIGFHSIPRDYRGRAAQSVADLGKPLSAGCIRQRMRDAVFLWDFAHVGTSVVVTP